MASTKRNICEVTVSSDSDSDCNKTPPREVPCCKKKVKVMKREQHFKKEYTSKWPCLVRGKKGEKFCYCSVCNCEFSISHGGRNDCNRHIASKKHTDFVEAKKSEKITGFFVSGPSTSTSSQVKGDHKTTRAEVKIVEMVTELNLPLSTCDTFSKVFKTIFLDSDIAKQISCGRSKATAIIKEVSAKTSMNVASRLRQQPFTISTDGSNDSGSNKLFPVVVRTYHPDTLEVRSEVLSVPACEGSATGKAIFDLLDREVQHVHNIPWKNCIAIGSDNANVMVGKTNGVYGHLLNANPSVYLAECPCHLIHIAAEKGASSLPSNIEQLLIDVYYYLDKSIKRQSAFKDMQLYHDIKQNKILKHVSTRWLSISICLPRLTQNWDALYDFFKVQENEAKTPAEKERVAKLRKIFQSPTNQLYCLFLSHAIKPFVEFNTELQSESPKLHVLKGRLESLLRKLFICFVKPSALLYKIMSEVDFESKCNIKTSSELVIGQEAMDFIENKKSLTQERIQEFYTHIVLFYKAACKYIKSKLPLKDELLNHAQVADPSRQTEGKFASIKFLINEFPVLLPADSTLSDVKMEFALCQSTDISSCKVAERVDLVWGCIAQLKENDQPLFKVLPKVMAAILTIPHSSAHCERIFSIVRKNKTEFRSRMGLDLLEALVVSKSRDGSVLDREYLDTGYSDFKSAYYRHLKSN